MLALLLGRGEGHLSPWKYLYSTLIYLTCIPGIFAITLSLYMFLFERDSVMNFNLVTQFLPILSMVLTIALIRRNVSLDLIPGFGKLSGLLWVLFVVIILLWILDRMRIFTITVVPFTLAVLIIGILVLVAVLGVRRMRK